MDSTAAETIRQEIVETSLGRMLVSVSEDGVCEASFGEDDTELLQASQRRFRGAVLAAADARTHDLAEALAAAVDAPTDVGDLPLDMRGTVFQRAVWEQLRAIPTGTTISYGELARRIGRPRAVRAVAQACGANPIAVIVPCHRVIGADGSLTGYASGIERKRALLQREGAL
ncbi:MAG: methylated-DNA--[protein]-cysteine S-methyltransferase [Coriobacteriia bacterium]|jgi:AraC family transcriptional regulator of adaptative response/methylated-DNA-[protein]-cysteine methyltransferase|nr:methylated-DNA--[protein]-cysteine S-methyltransferase [Coriobacteriia bacterium]